jgi:hypothetical protein
MAGRRSEGEAVHWRMSTQGLVGGLQWCDSDHNVFMFRRLICVMMVTAFRLGEVVSHTSFSSAHPPCRTKDQPSQPTLLARPKAPRSTRSF